MTNTPKSSKNPKTHLGGAKAATRLAHMGRPSAGLSTPVNPSVQRASTLLFSNAEDLYRSDIRTYGRHGMDAHDALKACFNNLEGGAGTSLTPSGLSACTLAILANVKAGDHILITDSAYGPVREFCLKFLSAMNIETERYDPHIGARIDDLIRDNTAMILLESPGSLTLEVQDVPAICEAARRRGVVTSLDNTWSAGLSLKPLDLGVDISVQAATKYVGGHSDILFGAVTSKTPEMAKKVAAVAKALGLATSPDDAYEVLRGMRSLTTRFQVQSKTALSLARWLEGQPQVRAVRHPALPSFAGHKLWKRDFFGGGGLFSFVLEPVSSASVITFVNALKLFGTGFSFGGYESVVIHCDPQLNRRFPPNLGGPLIRIGCGLEDAGDLKKDLQQALKTLS